jgi:hypothetical protein
MNVDLPSGNHLVCPRCGASRGEERFCSSCGLNLELQEELPTADAYTARVRERQWLEQREAPTERMSALPVRDAYHAEPPPSSPSQWPKSAIALAAVTLVLVLAAVGLLAAVLLDNSSENDPALLDPKAVATDSRTVPADQNRTTAHSATSTNEGKSTSTAGSLLNRVPTARTPGARGVRATIVRHWKKREDQQLSAAYADLTPRLQATAAIGSESVWIARQKEDLLQKVIVRVQPSGVKKRTAQANVIRLRTEALRSGCKEWSGTYSLVRSAGRWLIDSASISQRPC